MYPPHTHTHSYKLVYAPGNSPLG